jgi:hypothetical protein
MLKTRRYSIEIKDPDNNPVLFAAVDWTEEERLIAVAQIMRLAGLPVDKWSPGDEPGREVCRRLGLRGVARFIDSLATRQGYRARATRDGPGKVRD